MATMIMCVQRLSSILCFSCYRPFSEKLWSNPCLSLLFLRFLFIHQPISHSFTITIPQNVFCLLALRLGLPYSGRHILGLTTFYHLTLLAIFSSQNCVTSQFLTHHFPDFLSLDHSSSCLLTLYMPLDGSI